MFYDGKNYSIKFDFILYYTVYMTERKNSNK